MGRVEFHRLAVLFSGGLIERDSVRLFGPVQRRKRASNAAMEHCLAVLLMAS